MVLLYGQAGDATFTRLAGVFESEDMALFLVQHTQPTARVCDVQDRRSHAQRAISIEPSARFIHDCLYVIFPVTLNEIR